MKVEDGNGNIKEIAPDTSIIVFGTKPEPDLAHAICNAYPTARAIEGLHGNRPGRRCRQAGIPCSLVHSIRRTRYLKEKAILFKQYKVFEFTDMNLRHYDV